MVKIVSVGTANIDFILKVPSFVEPDSEMNVEKLHISPGGSALNFAVHVARSGLESGIIAMLGWDYFGDMIYKTLKDEDVDIGGISRTDDVTGMTFISVDGEGRRSIYSFMGANRKLTIGKKETDYISSANFVHLGGTFIEIAFPVAKNADTLFFSPGTLLAVYGISRLRPILGNTDILFLNEHELQLLTGSSSRGGVDLLIEEGIPLIIITRGKRGAALYTENEIIEHGTKEVKAADTTGAGDAFAAAFISSWVGKEDLSLCLKKGNEYALKNIKKLGAI